MNKYKKNILVAGGDLRQVTIAKLFSNEHNVFCVGIDDNSIEKFKTTVDDLIINNIRLDYIIFPMPLSVDNNLLNTPFSNKQIVIDDILSLCCKDTTIFGGKISNVLQEHFEKKKIRFFDYLQREELAILNAQVTSEGAIQIIMEELPKTIFQTKCLVVGFGRIGKILSKQLSLLGADVSVCARSYKDLATIETYNLNAFNIKDLKTQVTKNDCIINTVPATLFDKEILKEIKKGNLSCQDKKENFESFSPLLLDLASKPGGIDLVYASKLGLNAIWALSLPGKIAPITAGKIVYKTILNIESERSFDCE
ncbi:MAG: dipicolinate synthase subunit DpsA [Oscillospiraceae bacterium]